MPPTEAVPVSRGLDQPSGQPGLYSAYLQRLSLPPGDPRHAELGPEEHRQFMQELAESNPLQALAVSALIPLYTAGKAVGAIKARSPASVAEMSAGYQGMFAGFHQQLLNYITGGF